MSASFRSPVTRGRDVSPRRIRVSHSAGDHGRRATHLQRLHARSGRKTRTEPARRGDVLEAACKPSSVVSRCEHRSRTAIHLRDHRELSEQPAAAEASLRSPIQSVLGQSLPRFTPPANQEASSLWRWSSPHGGQAIPADPALWSSDFPPDAAFRPMRPRPSGASRTAIVLDSNVRSISSARRPPRRRRR